MSLFNQEENTGSFDVCGLDDPNIDNSKSKSDFKENTNVKDKHYASSDSGFKVTYHRLAQRTDWLNIRTRDIPYASVVNILQVTHFV